MPASKTPQPGRLFNEDQGDLLDTSLEEQQKLRTARSVECLGQAFPNDEVRRQHYITRLAEKLKDPEVRKIEGFPVGKDDDILALSDPPYYTACPNPWLGEFVKAYGKRFDPNYFYHREPFAADVSEGKGDPIYNIHSYHTKVPPKAIMRYLLHYTEPDDVVLDGFCGTGMTGVAAQLCGDRSAIRDLGYRVDEDGTIRNKDGNITSKIGTRRAILSDLSPAASFIGYNYTRPIPPHKFERDATRALDEVADRCGWMYATLHQPTTSQLRQALEWLGGENPSFQAEKPDLPWSRIRYVVWSQFISCPNCGAEDTYWHLAVDQESRYRQAKEESIICPKCKAGNPFRAWQRVFATAFDQRLQEPHRAVKCAPVLLAYSYGERNHEKYPDQFDLALIKRIEQMPVNSGQPLRLPPGDEARRNDEIGLTHVHHFFTARTSQMLNTLGNIISKSCPETNPTLRFWAQSVHLGFTVLNRYLEASFSQVNRYLKGTLYVAPFTTEVSPWYALAGKIRKIKGNLLGESFRQNTVTSTGSATVIGLPNNSVDYIFTDPPFGGNIMYSELNFLWEAGLKVFTNNGPEAVQNETQNKSLFDYEHLMTRCFEEYNRVLKPGRWITVEFHNSKNSVWNSIQVAMQQAGFVVADVRTLDKQQMTMQQMTSSGAVKQDLVISAYKPNGGLESRFQLEAGTEEGVWDFIKTHLGQLPVFAAKDGQAQIISERQNFLLFDRMVAFHVQHGVMIPLSASEFYQGLTQRFQERDTMFFLPDQAMQYDRGHASASGPSQLVIFVTNEATAIQWLRQILTATPQSFQQIHPTFMRELAGWRKHEKPLELIDLLHENFLCYNGAGEIPPQIHSYLSSNYKEYRSLPKDDERLRAKGRDRWYVPDPRRSGDLEQLRERALLKEFEDYRVTQSKSLKVFRIEAVRCGFKKAWQAKDYGTIIEVGRKLDQAVVQEDPKLLMWLTNALNRAGVEQ